MKKTKVTKTIVKDSGDSRYGMRSSLRSSGRVRKRTILGEKFDYGEKVKEKRNYIMYVSGQGQEKQEIEEFEEIPPPPKPKEKVVEEKEIIDNYQYHETKNLSKKKSRHSTTYHERLSTPFERTTIRRYESYTPQPRIEGYKKIEFSRNYGKKDHSNYSSLTSNAFKNKRDYSASNIYETYKPSRYNKNNFKTYNYVTETNRSSSNYSSRIPTIKYEKKTKDNIIKKEYQIRKENNSESENNYRIDKRDNIMKKEKYKTEKENNSESENNYRIDKRDYIMKKEKYKTEKENNSESVDNYRNFKRDDINEREEFRNEKKNNSESENNFGNYKRDYIIQKEEYKIEGENTSVSANNFGKDKSQEFVPQQVVEYELHEDRKFNENIPEYHQVSIEIGSPQKKIIRNEGYYEEVNTNERREEFPEMPNQNNYEYTDLIEEREITQEKNEERPFERIPAWKKPNYPICRPFPLPKYSKSPKGYEVRFRKIEFRQNTSRPKEKYIRRIKKEYIRDGGNQSERYERNYNHQKIPQFCKRSQNKYIRDLRSHGDNISYLNRDYVQSSSYRNINYEQPKIPGRGTRVGATDLEEKIGLDSNPYPGMSYSQYRKYEQKCIRNRENDDNQYNDDIYENHHYNRKYENQNNYNNYEKYHYNRNYENQDNYDNDNDERYENERHVEHYEKRNYCNTEGNYDDRHHHHYNMKYEDQNDYNNDNENMYQNYEKRNIYRNYEINDYNHYDKNNYNQENLDYQGDYYERSKEIFCPVHGRQIVRINDEYE